MTHAVVDVQAAGLQTTVQDLGRWGHQAEGVPVAGAMDLFSLRLANLLVGNDTRAAALEITLTGPTLQFGDTRRIAVAGAEFVVTLDGVPVQHQSALVARRGSTLRFEARRRGARAYLAVEGGIDVPPVLGSRATHLPSGTGGLDGRALAKGDLLRLGLPVATPTGKSVPVLARREPAAFERGPASQGRRSTGDIAHVRVLAGPQHERFADSALSLLVSAPYTIAVEANRMGYRLAGSPLPHSRGADIIPDATPLGSVQVPATGQPVVLMADRQTTGGYAKLATVIAADIPVLAQAAPGDRILFQVCSRATAVRALIEQERRLLSVLSI